VQAVWGLCWGGGSEYCVGSEYCAPTCVWGWVGAVAAVKHAQQAASSAYRVGQNQYIQ
jgi:acetyl-CoA carboxylase carboxyltransferase component